MKHVKLFEQFIAESVDLVHVYDKDGEMYGTGELVKTKGKKSLIRWDGSNEEWIDSNLVKMVESAISEKREDVGKYNTVKKAMKAIKKEYGPTPTVQSVASFINDNYYDVTEVERGDDDPRANDKIADLIATYKFDIEEWEIAWADAQNESVVTEALAPGSKIEKNLNKALKANINMFGDNDETIKVLDTPVRIERSQYDKEMNGRSKNFGASIMYMYGSRTNEYDTSAVIGVISRTKGTAKVFLYSEETYNQFAKGASFKEYEGASVLEEFQNKTRDIVSHLSKFPADGSANESIVTEAKPAGLSKKETLKVAQKFAAALTKLDGMKYTVSSDYEEDSFDLDIEDQDDVDPRTTGEYAGGSYNINADGSVVNMAVSNKKNSSPVYGNMDDDIKTIIKTIKNIKESVVTEAKNSKEIKELEELLKSIKSNTPFAKGRKAAIQDDIERLKNESVVTEGYGEFIKAKNLTDIVNLSKENKRAVFYVTDDNNSRIGTFYLKNGKFAKATSANPNHDLKNNKTSLRDRSDVIYKYKVDESVVTESFRVGKVLAIKKYNVKTNRKEVVDVRVTDYIKKPGSKDFVEYDLKGKKRKVSVDVFKSMIAEDAVNVTPESDVTIDNYTTDGSEEILSVEIVGAIVSSETEDEFLQYFYDTYGEGAFTKADTSTLTKYYNEYVEEVTAKETEEEEEAEKAEGGDDELDMDI